MRPMLRAAPTRPRPSDNNRKDDPIAFLSPAAPGHEAWIRFVRQFQPRLRAIARSFRLPAADVDDVVQDTWLELLEQFEQIREPAAIAGWLGTVARRKALRRLQTSVHEQLSGDPGLGDGPTGTGLDADLIAAERRDVLRRAIATLPTGRRELMTALLAHPDLDYRGLGSVLDIPIGSIGPTRARCLERLMFHPEIRGLRDC